jgi:hypothetical protein
MEIVAKLISSAFFVLIGFAIGVKLGNSLCNREWKKSAGLPWVRAGKELFRVTKLNTGKQNETTST